MPIETDVAILGGGPGGYTAAVRAAQAGRSVVIVERDKLGGTCLHRGCIPSKSLLRSAEVYATVRQAQQYGVAVPGEATVDWKAVHARKDAIVAQLYAGVQALMKQNKIQVIQGDGRITGPSIFSPRSGAIAVELPDGDSETVVAKHVILATGSRPRRLAELPYDGQTVVTSDEALSWTERPASVLIVGGGVIGVEWASLLSDFGTAVTLVEAADRLLSAEDKDTSSAIAKSLSARGVRILTGAQLNAASCQADEQNGVSVEVSAKGKQETLSAARMMVSVGRQGNVEGIGLENTDVKTANGFIAVNPATLQTGEPHIYAIGDAIGGVQLAHAAMHEGEVAVRHLLGEAPDRCPDRDIPRCIYSRPEAASIGWTEEAAKAAGYPVQTAKIPLRILGKALVHGESEGFAKVIADAQKGDLLGVHLVGAHATELIAESSLARLLDAVPWEVGRAIHPHPTLSEIVQETMHALAGSGGHA